MSDLKPTSDFNDEDQQRNKKEPPHHSLRPGTMVDGYRILSTLGEGGFGIVYVAETEKPIRRRVALKVIKPGMDSKQIIARFEAERQALAVMDHPNVAKVFDAGMTDTGHSYFVMEHVKGVSLTEHCDRQRLSIRERLLLFIEACEAVQHAHQKGIIHRDLKPPNILVSIEGNRAIPKVIDFGVAKAMAVPLTEKTLYTEQGQIIGTPEYMSPEQAEMTGQDIDTRTDIYSLGVIMYQLLTGVLPFSAEYLRKGGIDHLRRVIREEEPTSPSTKVTSLDGNDAKQITASRQVELSELKRTLKGDLDWIALKAMEKDRQRRYETAHGLAMDVERYLANEPIVARPPSTAYRLSKVFQRNKAACLATLAVFAALIVGLAAASWGLVEANRQRGVAQSERDDAQKARESAEEAKAGAAARADELERQNYLLRLANVDRAVSKGKWMWAEEELDGCPETQRGWEWSFLRRRVRETFSQSIPGSEQPAFTRDGKRLVAIGAFATPANRLVKVWDIKSNTELLKLEHDQTIAQVALSPDETLVAGSDYVGGVFLFNMETGEKLWSAKPHTGRTDGLAFSPDGRLLATANCDGTAKVLDASSGDLRYTVGPFEHRLRKVSFSLDGKWFAVGFFEGEEPPMIIDASTGHIAATFPGEGNLVATFSPDGQLIATGNMNGVITLSQWNGSDLTVLKTIEAVEGIIGSLAFNQDGKLLASGEINGRNMVKIWDVSDGVELASVAMDDNVYWLKMSPTSDHVAIFTTTGGIRLWQFGDPGDELTFKVADHRIRPVKYSPDGRKTLVGCLTDDSRPVSAYMIDTNTGRPLFTIADWSSGGSWTPDGKHCFISTSPDFAIRMLDAETGTPIRTFTGHSKSSFPFVRNGGCSLASVSVDGTIRTWDIKSGTSTGELTFESEKELRHLLADVSHDAALVALVLDGFTFEIWDTRARRLLESIDVPVRWESVIFVDSGTSLCCCGSGGTLMCLDAETGRNKKYFRGHEGTVWAAAANPSGDMLVSAGTSGRILVWDVESTWPIFTLAEVEEEVCSLDWSIDGRRIVAGLRDGTIKIWTLFD